MAGYVSLESTIRTCKPDVAHAERAASDRFLNPTQMVCPAWTGYDLVGRNVCENSFMTKAPGCHSARDRITVENEVTRPHYSEFITLNTSGITGNLYGDIDDDKTSKWDSMKLKSDVMNIHEQAGQFGHQFQSMIRSSCGTDACARAMGYNGVRKYADGNTALRNVQALQSGYNSFAYRSDSGM